MNVVESSVRTNIGQEEINALIKMKLTDMASWSISAIAVDGYTGPMPSYAMGGEELSSMIPYYDTVYAAIDALREFTE